MRAQNVTISFSHDVRDAAGLLAFAISTPIHTITVDFADHSDVVRIVEALAPALGAIRATVSVPSAERDGVPYRIGFAYSWSAAEGWDAEEDRAWRRDWMLWESPERWEEAGTWSAAK